MNHSFAFHLFPYSSSNTNQVGRPYANEKMRATFGPMCDAPSPKEYIDLSTDQETIHSFLTAMREGQDIVSGVICRTLKNGKPASILSLKHLHSYRHPEIVKYRYAALLYLI
jgi:hypothetical protein